MGVLGHLRHPETWPCDGCGQNHADVYTMPSGDVLCVQCELRERRAADHTGAVDALARIVHVHSDAPDVSAADLAEIAGDWLDTHGGRYE